MRFARGSVQRLAAGALISLQAKLLVVENIFTSAQAATADDDAVNSLFVHRITVDEAEKKTNTGTSLASAIGMSSSIASLPNNAIPPFQETTADVGVLFPAVSFRSSTADGGKKNTSTPSSSSSTTLSSMMTPHMPSQHQQAVDAGNLFSSHASTTEGKTNNIETRRNAPLLPSANPTSFQVTDVGVLLFPNKESASASEGKDMDKVESPIPGSIALLSSPSMSLSQQATCTEGYVDCYKGKYIYEENGYWYYDGTTCRDACGGLCCNSSETGACDLFTGKVCKDGSCSGEFACYFANIPRVVNSCIGDGACRCEWYEFKEQCKVSDSVINSCQGEYACKLIGGDVQEDGGGAVNNVINSCNGEGACTGLGLFGSFCGDVISSCHGYNACFVLGYNGTMSGLSNSCNEDFACVLMARDGSVGNVADACNAKGACYAAGSGYCTEYVADHICLKFYEGGIDDLFDCCNEHYACRGDKVSDRASWRHSNRFE